MSCGLLGSREVTNETLRVTQKKKNRKDNFFLNAGGTKLKKKKKQIKYIVDTLWVDILNA